MSTAELIKHIKALSKDHDGLKKYFAVGTIKSHHDDILNELSPATDGYGYMFVLGQKMRYIQPKDILSQHFFLQIKLLCIEITEAQIKIDTSLFVQLARKLATLAIDMNLSAHAIHALSLAVAKLQGRNANLLTPVHAELLMVCIKAHNYRAALPIVSVPIFELSPKADGMNEEQLLRFFYYSGMVFATLKMFSEAVEAFSLTFCVPGTAVSKIQVESYKKYILVCLIHYRELVQPSSEANSQLMRVLEKHCEMYVRLAQAFSDSRSESKKAPRDREKEKHEVFPSVAELLEQSKDVAESHNLGLLKQVRVAYTRKQIQQLTKTYVVLPLSDIVAKTGLKSVKEAEDTVRSMIAANLLRAKVDQKSGMLSFEDEADAYSTAKSFEALNSKIKMVSALNERLHAVGQSMELTKGYLQATEKSLEQTRGAVRKGGMMEDDAHMQQALTLSISEQ